MFRSACNLFLALTLFTSLQYTAYAQEVCVAKGATLTDARANFAAQCSVKRIDCDPFNGQWYCASYRMTSSAAPAVTTSQPTTPAPEPAPAVAVQPAPEPIQPVVVAPVPEPTPPVVVAPTPEPTPPVVVAPEPTPAIAEQPTPVAPITTPSNTKPPCTTATSDSDNDGWGWENNRSCRVVSTTPSEMAPANSAPISSTGKQPADITDLILITGQSNVLGAGTSYDPSLDGPSGNVFAFTNNGWQEANLRQIWDHNWHPRNHPETDPSNNFALHFGKTATALDSSRVIGFILVSNPGAKISQWNYGSSFYNTVQAKTLDAINQLPHKSAVDGILWHQGESDGEDKQYYTDALYGLINNFRNEPWVASQAPFICGETKIRSVNNRLNGLNHDNDPTTACVAAEDLSTAADNRHFDSQGLRTLGERYAYEYLRIRP